MASNRLWEPAEDRIILDAISNGPRSMSWAAVADELRQAGYTRTVGACRVRGTVWRRRYGLVNGRWTAEQDTAIRAAMTRPEPDWPAVAAQLGRTRTACATRAYNLRKQDLLAS